MHTSIPSEVSRPFFTWQRILDWAQEHYRCRVFSKDERIPARPELLYLVERGAVRLLGTTQLSAATSKSKSRAAKRVPEEAFLGFVGAGQPFEIVGQSSLALQAYAHVDQTSVLWMYWNDLDNWPHFRREILDAFRYQHQRKLLWLGILGQRRTIDRLLGLIALLIEEYGEPCELLDLGGDKMGVLAASGDRAYCLPWSLTHAQIGSAIGSTRVTVTRLMGKLRASGLIYTYDDRIICLPGNRLLKIQNPT